MAGKIGDKLGGEGDFGNKKDDRLFFDELTARKFDINVGFAAAGDAVEQNGIGGILHDGVKGEVLGVVEKGFGGGERRGGERRGGF